MYRVHTVEHHYDCIGRFVKEKVYNGTVPDSYASGKFLVPFTAKLIEGGTNTYVFEKSLKSGGYAVVSRALEKVLDEVIRDLTLDDYVDQPLRAFDMKIVKAPN